MMELVGAAANALGGGGMPGLSSSANSSNSGGNIDSGVVNFGDSSVDIGGGDNAMMIVGIVAAAAVIGLAVWKR